MNVPTEIILQYGGFALIAVFFGFTLRWLLATMDRMKECHAKATEGFIEAANNFSQVMANHLNGSTHATEQLIRIIEELRRELK